MKTGLKQGLATAGRTVARRLHLDRQAAFWRRELWDERARLVDIVRETRDAKTFVLDPGRGWGGHRAGQHTTIEVEVDGVRVRRCYSIASAPGGRELAITVKRTPGGRVSGWLHERARVGDRIAVAPASGDFVLPAIVPERLLFVSGGSGVTPVMAMLRDLAARGALGDVVVLHYDRRREDVIFGAELEALAAAHPRMRLDVGLSQAPSLLGRFDEAALAHAVPDFATRAAFVCGPAGLMARVDALWQQAGAAGRLRRERFVLPRPAAPSAYGQVTVRLARSARTVSTGAAEPLLDGLERAGVQPAYGCRMGICQTCRCRKTSGVVENLLTGARSSEGEEEIQLCISAPRSDVELNL